MIKQKHGKPTLIYGFHAVNARLWQNPKSITELYVQKAKNDARTRDVLEKAANENVRVHFADADRLNAISKGARHQGVVGFIDASKTMFIWKMCWKT